MIDDIIKWLETLTSRVVVLETMLVERDCRKCGHYDKDADWCDHYNRLTFSGTTCDAWKPRDNGGTCSDCAHFSMRDGLCWCALHNQSKPSDLSEFYEGCDDFFAPRPTAPQEDA